MRLNNLMCVILTLGLLWSVSGCSSSQASPNYAAAIEAVFLQDHQNHEQCGVELKKEENDPKTTVADYVEAMGQIDLRKCPEFTVCVSADTSKHSH